MFELIKNVLHNFLFFFLHLSSPGSFPKPLSQKKEAELIEKFKNENDTTARSELIEHNLRLVAHIVKKYYSSGTEQDDLVSIGTLGLIKGIDNFKPEKGTKLATYASRCIENEILMYFRAKKKDSVTVSFEDPIDIDSEGNPLTQMDIVFKDNTIIEDIELSKNTKKLYKLIDSIDDEREKNIIVCRYGLYGTQPMTQREIADKIGISRSYVSRIEKKVIEKLQKEFETDSNETYDE